MRIVSLLPTATEIVCALGLQNSLVGISHECNYPNSIKNKPRVSTVDFDYSHATSREIDSYVEKKMHTHKSLYTVDKKLLQKLLPSVVITQELCNVCAVTPLDVQKVLHGLPSKPEVVSLHPKSLADICTDIVMIGKQLGKEKQAILLVEKLTNIIKTTRHKTAALPIKRVVCVEWFDPLFPVGHWVPEMVEIAGGEDLLGFRNEPSKKRLWEEVVKTDPEILILMPCGFSQKQAKKELQTLTKKPFWNTLSAVKNRQVWLTDGPSYFNQSGPRVITKGIEILAKIMHPEVFGRPTKREAVNSTKI